jgi:putative SOS response-associated peptidase YedK
MRVILRTAEEKGVWMGARWAEANALQQPPLDDARNIMARGEKTETVDE